MYCWNPQKTNPIYFFLFFCVSGAFLNTPWQRWRCELSPIQNNGTKGRSRVHRLPLYNMEQVDVIITHSHDRSCSRHKKWGKLILHMGNSKTLIHSDCSLKILILWFPRVPQYKKPKEPLIVKWGRIYITETNWLINGGKIYCSLLGDNG